MEAASPIYNSHRQDDLLWMLYTLHGIAESKLAQIQNIEGTNFKDILSKISRELNQIVEQTDRLLTVLNQETDLKRLKGKIENIHHASVSDSVRDALKILRRKYSFDRVTIVKMVDQELPLVPLKKEHLDTIILHLLSQARRAIYRNGGMILIEAREETIEGHEMRDHFLKICISDTGSPIPHQDLDHLFDPVFETHSCRFGDGFGLYTVRKLVEQYHGKIRVDTGWRKASFSVAIPLQAELPSAQAA